MNKHEQKLVDTLALLTIVVALSSMGSMYVYYIGTFEQFLFPPVFHQVIIIILGILSFFYLGLALRLYHKKR